LGEAGGLSESARVLAIFPAAGRRPGTASMVTNSSPARRRLKFSSALKLQRCVMKPATSLRAGNQLAFRHSAQKSALLRPYFSCWLDPQSDFGFRPNAVEARSLRIFPKAGLWRGSQRCVSA